MKDKIKGIQIITLFKFLRQVLRKKVKFHLKFVLKFVHLSKKDFKVPCHLLTFIEDIMKNSKGNVISPPVNVISTFRMGKGLY
jgi:hypothetical protein